MEREFVGQIDRTKHLERVGQIHDTIKSLINQHDLQPGNTLRSRWSFSPREPIFTVVIDHQAAFGVFLVKRALVQEVAEMIATGGEQSLTEGG